jgi:large subunit ribosomal protein L29
MKAADLRAKTVQELKDEVIALRKAQFNLRMQAASGQTNNAAQVNAVRKDIARVKTVLTEKQKGE